MFLVPHSDAGPYPRLRTVEDQLLAHKDEWRHDVSMPPSGIGTTRLTQFDHVASEFHPSLSKYTGIMAELVAATYPDDAVVMAGYTRHWMNLLFDTSIIGEEWVYRGKQSSLTPDNDLFHEQTDYIYQRTKARLARSARDAVLNQTEAATRFPEGVGRVPRMAVLREMHKYVLFGCALEDYDVTDELELDDEEIRSQTLAQFDQIFSFYGKGTTSMGLRTKLDTEERESRESLERLVYFSQNNLAADGTRPFDKLLSEKDMDWLFLHRLGVAHSNHFLYVNLAHLRVGFREMPNKRSKRLRESFFRKWFRYIHDSPIAPWLINHEDGSLRPLDRIPLGEWGPVHIVFIPIYIAGNATLWIRPGDRVSFAGHWVLCVYYTQSKTLYFFDPNPESKPTGWAGLKRSGRAPRFVTSILAESGLFSLETLRSTGQVGHWPASRYVRDTLDDPEAADDMTPAPIAEYVEAIPEGGWPLDGDALPMLDFVDTELVGKTYLQKESWECGYMTYLVGLQIVRSFYADARATVDAYPEAIGTSSFVGNMTGFPEDVAIVVANPGGLDTPFPFYDASKRLIHRHHTNAVQWLLAQLTGVADVEDGQRGPWTAERLVWRHIADATGDAVLPEQRIGIPPFIRMRQRPKTEYLYYLSILTDAEGQPVLAPMKIKENTALVVSQKDAPILPAEVASCIEYT